MNICFLCRSFLKHRGGTESYYFRMANALAAKGHIVHIVAQEGEEKSYYDGLNPLVLVHRIRIKEEPFRGSWRIEEFFPFFQVRYSIAIARKIKKIQKSYPIDIIQAPDWSLEGFWLTIQKKPLFVRLHGTPNPSDNYPSQEIKVDLKKRLIKKIGQHTISQAYGVSSVSDHFAQFVKESLRLSRPIKIIYNGIDQTIYKSGNFQREHSVLFVGRLEQEKGIKVIAEAIPIVLKDFPDIKFIFAGRSMIYQNTTKTWKDYLSETLPEKNLVFYGQISAEKLVSCYQKSLISIFPSFIEAGGTASLESMACGCATIATRVGGFLENIEDGKDGLLIPQNNPEALADAIKRLLKDDALRKNISVNAIQKITTKFNLNKAIEQTVQFYEEVIGKNYGR